MPSWYKNTREGFLQDTTDQVVGLLHMAAANENWVVDPDQTKEWHRSVEALRNAVAEDEFAFIEGVLAEYDFRRRGLRVDFVLLAGHALFVLEFKRSTASAADRDQVMNYCVNFVEFHELTQTRGPCLLPVLVTRGAPKQSP